MLVTESRIIIGGILLTLAATGPGDAFEVDPIYLPEFAGHDSGNVPEEDRLRLEVSYGTPQIPGDTRELFDTEGAWKLLNSEAESSYYVMLSSPRLDPPLYKVLAIDEELTQGTIFINCQRSDTDSETIPLARYPLRYPLDEMLMANLLARGRGVEMHGLGVVHEGRGFLFSGKSGAGKSTLGTLWRERRQGEILNTDRLIVRPGTESAASSGPEADSGYQLYGTPWHGDGERVYGGAPLAAILILRQADENRLVELEPVAIASALLVRSFPTFWDARGLQWTVDMLGRLSTEVPCFELHFRPEQDAIDLVLDTLTS